jgi:hypothetical protein
MGNIVKPMKPDEVLDRKIETIPDAMFEAVNAMIALKWNGSSAHFRQDDLLNKYFEISKETDNREARDKLFDNHYMDFEGAYRREGWIVRYDKPGYNESYEPTFEFTIKK